MLILEHSCEWECKEITGTWSFLWWVVSNIRPEPLPSDRLKLRFFLGVYHWFHALSVEWVGLNKIYYVEFIWLQRLAINLLTFFLLVFVILKKNHWLYWFGQLWSNFSSKSYSNSPLNTYLKWLKLHLSRSSKVSTFKTWLKYQCVVRYILQLEVWCQLFEIILSSCSIFIVLHLVAHSPSSLIGGWNCCTVIHQPWLVSSCNWSTHLRSAVRIKVNWLKFDLFIDKNYPLLLEDLFNPSAREFFDINLLLSFKLFLFIFNIRRLTDVKLTSVQLGWSFRNKRFERYWASNRFIVLICVLRAANRYFGLFLFLLIVISNDKLLFNIRGGTRCSGGTDTDPACSDPTVSDIVSFANDGIVGSQLKELLLLLVLEAEFFKDCRSYFYDIICCWGLWAVFFTQSIVDYFSHGRSIFILVDILRDPL